MTGIAHSPRMSAGFSLLETLVALAVFSMVATVTIPLVRGPSASSVLKAESSTLALAFRATRSAALSNARVQALEIDVDRLEYASQVVNRRAIDPRVSLKVTVAKQAERGDRSARFLFFPNGQSSGGRVVMTLDAASSEVIVDWATGFASIR